MTRGHYSHCANNKTHQQQLTHSLTEEREAPAGSAPGTITLAMSKAHNSHHHSSKQSRVHRKRFETSMACRYGED